MNSNRLNRCWGLWLVFLTAGLMACGDDNGTTSPPTTGSLQVTVATAGEEVDPDGYTVTVGSTDQSVAVNGSVTFTSLSPATYTVTLSDVADNCTVQGGTSTQATVVAGQTASASFSVTCANTLGDLAVTASTTGENLDPDGYSFTVDGGTANPIGINETVTLNDLSAGTYSVELSGVANNCSLDGANPRDVTVSAGGTGSTTFAVSCVAIVGDLSVITSTTGDELDADGYTVSLDGGAGQAIGINDQLDIIGLVPGVYSVNLDGLAANCTLASGVNPRDVTVVADGVVQTTFDIVCAATVGDLRVITSTTGVNQDQDGYAVVVDAGTPRTIGTNDQITYTDLPVGSHEVGLFSLADNCRVQGEQVRTVEVTGGVVETTFDVACFSALLDKTVFVSDRDDSLFDIYIMNSDGTGVQRLTNNPALDLGPAVSPDGLLIAFWSRRGPSGGDIWVMGSDGSGPANVTDLGGEASEPAWSPDGTQLAFTYKTSGSRQMIWAINLDGSGLRRLSTAGQTYDDLNPSWSPDGATIIFTTNRDGDDEIYSMSSLTGDNGTAVNLTNNPGRDGRAQYSPDGTQIVWDAKRDGVQAEVWVMASDGTGQTQLTTNPANDYDPTFSSDGTRIGFVSERDGNAEIYEMNADGTGPRVRLTIDSAVDAEPDYSP